MDEERWLELETHDIAISNAEMREGWHWCPEWDYLLVGPGMDELQCCLCDNPWAKAAKDLTK